jgi:hypothetical protein
MGRVSMTNINKAVRYEYCYEDLKMEARAFGHEPERTPITVAHSKLVTLSSRDPLGMGVLAYLDPRLSDYCVVWLTIIVGLTVRTVEEAWWFMRPRGTSNIACSPGRLEGVVKHLLAPAVPVPGSVSCCCNSIVVLLSLHSRNLGLRPP